MADHVNYSVHDDISARKTFFIIQMVLHVIVIFMFFGEHYHYLFALIAEATILLTATFLLPKTPFPQDIRELLVLDTFVYIALFTAYCLPKKSYNETVDYAYAYQKVINAVYLARLLWPCRDKNGDFVSWPIFGPIGLITKLFGKTRVTPLPNNKQVRYGYLSIFVAIFIGWQLHIYNIKNSKTTAYFVIFIAALFASKKSVVVHKARVAAEAARIQAEQEKLAHERAEAARLAAIQMQNNLDALLATDAERSRAETIEEELAREKAEKAALAEKLAAFEAMHTPEADRVLKGLQALPEETRIKQMRVIEALEREVTYFDAEDE